MTLVTRRRLMAGLSAILAGGFATAAYGIGIEARRHRLVRYRLTPPGWPRDYPLSIAIVTDLHACEPWLGEARLASIVEETNALGCDIVLLLGDFVASRVMSRYSRPLPPEATARILAGLKAPLGRHAVLGNHDWWQDRDAQRRRAGPIRTGTALVDAGIPVYHNDCVRIDHAGRHFWLAGLADQWAIWNRDAAARAARPGAYEGLDDLPATLAKATDDAPVILMAHEPDIFPSVPGRVSLTLSGHTHGGQITFAGFAPVVPSRFGRRYVYGHVVEDDRHLIVSAGLGCTAIPMRFGVPPEIVRIDLGDA